MQRQTPTTHVVQKTVEAPHVQFFDKVADVPRSCKDRFAPFKREEPKIVQEESVLRCAQDHGRNRGKYRRGSTASAQQAKEVQDLASKLERAT